MDVLSHYSLESFIIFCGLFAISVSGALFYQMTRLERGTQKAQSISALIKENGELYARYRSRGILVIGAIVLYSAWHYLDIWIAGGITLGVLLNLLTSGLGAFFLLRENNKLLHIARSGADKTVDIGLKASSIASFLFSGAGLLTVAGYYFYMEYYHGLDQEDIFLALMALGLGATLVSVLNAFCATVLDKASSGLSKEVRSLRKSLNKRDLRNPAVMTKRVGQSVVGGSASISDLFETYLLAFIIAMLMGGYFFTGPDELVVIILPLLIGAVAIIATVASVFLMRVKIDPNGEHTDKFMLKTFALSIGMTLAGVGYILDYLYGLDASFGDYTGRDLFNCFLVGIAILTMIVSEAWFHTRAKSDHCLVRIDNRVIPVLMAIAGLMVSFSYAGLFGVALMTVTMLSLSSVVDIFVAYSVRLSHARTIAQMSKSAEKPRKLLDGLAVHSYAVRNIARSYKTMVTVFVSFLLFAIFGQVLNEYLPAMAKDVSLSLNDPYALMGLFFGGVLVYLFYAVRNCVVDHVVKKGINFVERQFKEIKGILQGKAKPNYMAVTRFVSRESLKGTLWLFAGFVIAPVYLFYTLVSKWDAVIGLSLFSGTLFGVIVTGGLLSFGIRLSDKSNVAIAPLMKVLNVFAIVLVFILFLS